jgi:hypothetical protein
MPAGGATATVIQTGEGLEDLCTIRLSNAGAIVIHMNAAGPVPLFQGDFDPAMGMLASVLNEVAYGAVHVAGVAIDLTVGWREAIAALKNDL